MDKEFRKWMRWFGKTHKPYKVGKLALKFIKPHYVTTAGSISAVDSNPTRGE